MVLGRARRVHVRVRRPDLPFRRESRRVGVWSRVHPGRELRRAGLESALLRCGLPQRRRAAGVVYSADRASGPRPLTSWREGIVLGAVGRLISAGVEGWPNPATTVFMLLEASVIVVPLWQRRIKGRYAASGGLASFPSDLPGPGRTAADAHS